MSDDYICSVCGHRAGDHAVSNRCLANDCDCKDDPYLEQLSALQAKLDEWAKEQGEVNDNLFHETVDLGKKLAIAVEAMKIDKIRVLELFPITGHTMLRAIDKALAKLEEK